jgi:subtilisin family serine protease
MLAARRRMALATGAAVAVVLVAAGPLSAGAGAAPADSVRISDLAVLDELNVPSAWQLSRGEGVTVAVIDSGVDGNVSDLTNVVSQGRDLTGLSTEPSNLHWGEHGTWMASIIAGHGNGFDDGDGIIGVAPEAKIYSIRVIPDKDDPSYGKYEAEKETTIQQSLATGIMDAVSHGARVISMSIGYSSASSWVRQAVQYAYSHGAVLVASSGNSGQDDESHDHGYAPVSFPANYPGVLSVAALDGNGAASFSSNNLSVQVAAPGVKVPAQGRDGLYWTVDGTSPACALVAGVAALIESKYPGISPALVIEALTSTALNSPPGYNARTGFGTVNAVDALDKAGQLEKAHGAGSQVSASAKFGGGPASAPAAPVSPRGVSQLVMFVILAIMSLALAVAGGIWLAVLGRPGKGAHAAPYPGPPASRYPPDGGYPGPGPGPGGYPGSGGGAVR